MNEVEISIKQGNNIMTNKQQTPESTGVEKNDVFDSAELEQDTNNLGRRSFLMTGAAAGVAAVGMGLPMTAAAAPMAPAVEGKLKTNAKSGVRTVIITDAQLNIGPYLAEEMAKSIPTKMIVIADGNIIKNSMGRNGPEELGYDLLTKKFYGNKEFLLNAVNYLLDDDGLINIRSKEIAIAFLEQQKVAAQKTKWQVINIVLPLVILCLFGFVFNFIRRKKYAKLKV